MKKIKDIYSSMKKIKDIYKFIQNVQTTKKKIKCISILLGTFFELPAFIFHEFMHILFMCQWNVFNITVLNSHFYEVVWQDPDNGNKPTIKTFALSINYDSTPLAGLITSAAPMIGWLFLFVYSISFSHWILLTYLILGFRMFFLSRQDIKAMKKCGCNRSLFRILWTINVFLGKNKNFAL